MTLEAIKYSPLEAIKYSPLEAIKYSPLEAIKYSRGKLQILNQLLLPHESVYEDICSVEDGWKAIKLMKVRGAPAIAIVGCLSLVVEMDGVTEGFGSVGGLAEWVNSKLEHLITARPTAVNLNNAAVELKRLVVEQQQTGTSSVGDVISSVRAAAEEMMTSDVRDNRLIGQHGADHVMSRVAGGGRCCVVTHCNTGSLATAGFGTALGVIRALHSRGALERVYCTETRPYNQGSRLTAYELMHDGIPATLIADSMVAALMRSHTIHAVIVGADRVASNGDVANKIGTYQLAVVAAHHQVAMYVAAPTTTHDPDVASGDGIRIELRPADELTRVGGVSTAPQGVECWNPAFDVTPAHLITGGIITERGVFPAGESGLLTQAERRKS